MLDDVARNLFHHRPKTLHLPKIRMREQPKAACHLFNRRQDTHESAADIAKKAG
jgi:hypothetical protein